MTKPNLDFKKKVLFAFQKHFETERDALVLSAKAAHLAATHEESRAEDRHDTFAIEASYLAAGQAVRVAGLEESIREMKTFLELQRAFDSVQVGALLTLKLQSSLSYTFVAVHGGGAQVQLEGKSVKLISPQSPLGELMLGLKSSDTFTVELKNGEQDYEIVEVI